MKKIKPIGISLKDKKIKHMNNDRVALVTGSSKGIGEYLAKWFIQHGYVTVGCSRQEPSGTIDGYTHFCVDVSDESLVVKMFSEIKKRFGRLDILVNNAGVASMNHFLLTPISTVNKILAINVQAVFLASREAAKIMMKNKFGRIINIGSCGVPLRIKGEAIYIASKSAVVGLSQVMARELADFGITVNVVGPTMIDTNMTRNVPREKLQHLVDQLAIKRFGTFEDIANVIDFFIRPESNYITGQVIYLGGT